MKQLIESFPRQIQEALEIADNATFKKCDTRIENVVICGLGGSGIGAKIVANWVQSEMKLPVILVNDYTLPAFASKTTLVIASSYSGNTEETLMAVETAHQNGCFIFGITSGGTLKTFCDDNGYDCVIVPGGNPPRSAVAYSLVQLVNYFVKMEFVSIDLMNQIKLSISLINEHEAYIHEQAQLLAKFLYGKVGVMYGETKYEGVIVRAKQQFNENAKFLLWHNVIPEMNHNELVGWGGGDERFATVFFNAPDLHPRNARRMEITKETIEKKCGALFNLYPKGESLVERSIYYIHLVDWASYYLCELNQVDIMDIKIIDYLKDELAKI